MHVNYHQTPNRQRKATGRPWQPGNKFEFYVGVKGLYKILEIARLVEYILSNGIR